MSPPGPSVTQPRPPLTREAMLNLMSPSIAFAIIAVRSELRSACFRLQSAVGVLETAITAIESAENTTIPVTYAPAPRMDNPRSPRRQHSTPHPKPDSMWGAQPPGHSESAGPGGWAKKDDASRYNWVSTHRRLQWLEARAAANAKLIDERIRQHGSVYGYRP